MSSSSLGLKCLVDDRGQRRMARLFQNSEQIYNQHWNGSQYLLISTHFRSVQPHDSLQSPQNDAGLSEDASVSKYISSVIHRTHFCSIVSPKKTVHSELQLHFQSPQGSFVSGSHALSNLNAAAATVRCPKRITQRMYIFIIKY